MKNIDEKSGQFNLMNELSSGFIVSLLALPLSLGIASASDFPNPLYGVLTAIIGGILVGLISGARLTIKGPAAGLIVICAGSIAAFGGGEAGWQMTLGVIFVAAMIQILFGVFKLGKLSDFFPLAAVHGMLAAIGMIVISKQVHILLGVNPLNGEGKPMIEPFELLSALPDTFSQIPQHMPIIIVGVISLIATLTIPLIRISWLKKIPTPIVVLAIAIPLGAFLHLDAEKGALLSFNKSFIDILNINISFAGMKQTGTFIQYVILFSLIGSLESLLTAKAIDLLDPLKKKSNFNKDLIAVGSGNALASVLGGLPMIAEVARSTNNVNNGAKTKWANVFHGAFLLIFMLALMPVLQLIPKAALAALLIGVGIKLAHPREFIHMLHIGKEQLAIFVTTIICTLAIDLLAGIAAGIIVKLIINGFNAGSFIKNFQTTIEIDSDIDGVDIIHIRNAAVFTNIMKIKKVIQDFHGSQHLIIDCSSAHLIDHTVMSMLSQLQDDYKEEGRILELCGLEKLDSFSTHPLSARIIHR
jgi:MFS superfamily sulfate permease-like transporter